MSQNIHYCGVNDVSDFNNSNASTKYLTFPDFKIIRKQKLATNIRLWIKRIIM